MTESLLSIDVLAEIRKLTEARFRSAGEYAVELCRHCLSATPSELRVTVNWRRFAIHADRSVVTLSDMAQLITLFDGRAPTTARHEALLALEASGHRALLALFSIPSARVIIETEKDGQPVSAIFKNREFRGWKRRSPGNPGYSVLSTGRQPIAERRMICNALYYCNVPWFLNGRKVMKSEQLRDCLYQVEIENSRLRGYSGLPESGNLVKISRLRNGVVDEELLRPAHRGFVFHSVVEEKDDEFSATLSTLERTAAVLYHKAAAAYFRFGRVHRERLRTLLLEAARRSGDTELLNELPLFTAVGRDPLSLKEAQRLCEADCLYAVEREARLPRLRMKGRVIMRLNAADRQFLESIPGIRLRELPVALPGVGLSLSLRFWNMRRALIQALRRITKREGIAEGDTETERAFAAAVRDALNERSPGQRALQISCSDDVRGRLAVKVAEDPTLLQAALLVLTEGDDRVL